MKRIVTGPHQEPDVMLALRCSGVSLRAWVAMHSTMFVIVPSPSSSDELLCDRP